MLRLLKVLLELISEHVALAVADTAASTWRNDVPSLICEAAKQTARCMMHMLLMVLAVHTGTTAQQTKATT
jgi:hypothetical protein